MPGTTGGPAELPGLKAHPRQKSNPTFNMAEANLSLRITETSVWSHWQSQRVPYHRHISPETSSLPLEAGFNFRVIPAACDITNNQQHQHCYIKQCHFSIVAFCESKFWSCARIHTQPIWGLQDNCTVSTVLQGGSEIKRATTKLLPYSPEPLQVDKCCLQESHHHFKYVSERAEFILLFYFCL